MDRIKYDEFGLFHENAQEFGIPFDGPPKVRRKTVALPDGRGLSALLWGDRAPEVVFLHGGAQNAHTWDTVALALGRSVMCIDLPGHGHSGPPRSSAVSIDENAADVALAIQLLAPAAVAVVGMSLGGITTLALASAAPQLVRRVVLVDVTPGVNPAKSAAISNFIDGPDSFPSFEGLLARTIEHNPTRTVASLRRGILHNAMQRDDGSWVWRYARFPKAATPVGSPPLSPKAGFPRFSHLWDAISNLTVPTMLVRGMRPQSVVDDDDEAELLRRLPTATVVHVDEAGHSVQGDTPVELAAIIADFISLPTKTGEH